MHADTMAINLLPMRNSLLKYCRASQMEKTQKWRQCANMLENIIFVIL